LVNADLSDADFNAPHDFMTGSNLAGADLTGASFTGANFNASGLPPN